MEEASRGGHVTRTGSGLELSRWLGLRYSARLPLRRRGREGVQLCSSRNDGMSYPWKSAMTWWRRLTVRVVRTEGSLGRAWQSSGDDDRGWTRWSSVACGLERLAFVKWAGCSLARKSPDPARGGGSITVNRRPMVLMHARAGPRTYVAHTCRGRCRLADNAADIGLEGMYGRQ